MKLEILIKTIEDFRQRRDVAIHVLEPTYNELLDAIDQANKDLFERIVVYVPAEKKHSMSNILNGMSTWSRLIRDLGEGADVRYGEVGYRYGNSDGDGFTIYFSEAS